MKIKGSYGILVLSLVLLMVACKSQKMGVKNGFHNEFFGIIGMDCIAIEKPDAIDSKVGTITCDEISFAYDFGPFSNPGPLTLEEEFTRAFDNYHHIKFFENRMIDPKVYKIFLDSVKVVDVRRKVDGDNLMFGCDPCNTVAELHFMGDNYLFPTTLSEDQLNEVGFSYTIENRDGFIYKYYKRDNELPGVYVNPINNRYKTKNTLSLIVTETTLTAAQAQEILQGTYMINNDK